MEKRPLGSYITREDLERRDVISNFWQIPGVRVDQCSVFGMARRGSNCFTVRFFGRGPGLGDFPAAGGQGGCEEPLIYIDGSLLTRDLANGSNAFNFLRQYPRDALEGIEVYRNSTLAPAQYRSYAACGVVLVWTRDRRSRSR